MLDETIAQQWFKQDNICLSPQINNILIAVYTYLGIKCNLVLSKSLKCETQHAAVSKGPLLQWDEVWFY